MCKYRYKTSLILFFAVVFGLTMIINKSSRVRRIDLEEQFIMAYGGLRGAVAFSLVDLLDKNNLPKGHFLTTTLVIIFFTVFVQVITVSLWNHFYSNKHFGGVYSNSQVINMTFLRQKLGKYKKF